MVNFYVDNVEDGNFWWICKRRLLKIIKKQAEMMKEALKKNDIVICTALIPGKPAPRILTDNLVKLLKPGSIIYDLAAEQGGNSAFSEPGKINIVNGVKIIGVKKLNE